ncbi:MAG: DNA-binding transcriptional regulator CueR [Methanocella sp. PtaU1.Bin125]|nr:MAG: DNA-binding transcriptional regulator CueR [Methanocella sp. PtaU1.Bin125]
MTPEEGIQISIGKFSQITSLSPRALRLYDEKGLLSPKRDRFNNYRFYSADQIETGLKIKTLSWMGFSCAEIDRVLAYLEDPAANEGRIEQLFKQRLAQTQIEIQKLKKVEEVLQGRKAIEVLYMTSTEPVIKEIPEVRVISRRGTGAPQEVIPGLIGAVMQQIFSPANQRGNVNINGPITLLFRHETLTKTPEEGGMAHMEFEIAVPVVGRISVEPGFDVKSLPGGKMVTLIYTGPYHEVGGAYTKAIDFVGRQGLQMNGLCREMYLNNPQEVPEDKLMTEIQIPVR